MVRKRKESNNVEISNVNDDPKLCVDRNEIMKLTKIAKSWEFTCSFCFKKFPSAQAMGGHQNAHRDERMEEKRLFVRDPISYRKRAYIRAMKAIETESSGAGGGSNATLNLHAALEMVKHELSGINGPPMILPGDLGEFNAASYGNNKFCLLCSSKDSPTTAIDINGKNMEKAPSALINFLPIKELSLAERVGVYAEDAKGMASVELDIGGYGNLDLNLKL